MKRKADVAIIGMSGMFPGAPDLSTYWKNIEEQVDAIRPAPAHRLDPVFFDGEGMAADRFYCNRGGFIDEFAFDPVKFGILPLAVEGAEPDHLLALHLARLALEDAGIFRRELSLHSTGIIIGKGNYAGPGATRAIEIVRTGEQIVQVLKNALPELGAAALEKVKREFQQQKGRFGADTVMGLIPNLAASLVANRLNLGGAAYTVDAACASSLIAIDHALHELHSGRCDMVLAGGLHIAQNAAFWSIFTQLGALSRTQQIRPFDRRADGLLIGEGGGFVVLKRLEDAVRDDHRIYAVIKGVGVASDGAGVSVLNPSVKGQSAAIAQAWRNAGLDPSEIGYLEAHGTGTPVGDRTELETLAAVFGNDRSRPKAGIGTVKSMIGHAMPAAGMAGLIKTALALYHGKLPPTLHCEEPLDIMSQTRFAPVQEAIDWDLTGLPKRAGVNAFGFGGINAHVILEDFHEQGRRRKPVKSTAAARKDDVLLLARATKEALAAALEAGETAPGQGNYRIAVFHPTPERIKKAVKIVQRGLPWRNRQDIWFTPEPLLLQGGRIAFLFPGLDGLSAGETDSIAEYFGLSRLDYRSIPETDLLHAAFQVVERSKLLDTALKQLGIQPHLNAGHSLGEWLAGRSAEIVEEASVLELLQRLNPATFQARRTRFLMVGCGYEQLKPLLAEVPDIYLSNDNCPQQVILCGTYEAVDQFIDILKDKQLFHQVLPFESGFHSPFVKDRLDQLLEGMQIVQFRKGKIPLWSATTLQPYPEDVEAIRQLNIEHLLQPVRFRELTEKLYQEGVRVFIQVGSGGLTGFVDDTLKGKAYSAVPSSLPVRSGLCQLQRVLAALFVEGQAIDMAFMGIDAPHQTPATLMKVQLGLPLINELPSLRNLSRKRPAPVVQETVADPVMQAFRDNMDEMTRVQDEILSLFKQQRNSPAVAMPAPPPPLKRRPVLQQLDISLQNTPWLIDHSLIRQKPGWHCPADMDPVIPMTMALELFGDIAAAAAPSLSVQRIMQVKVLQWMNVAAPFREIVHGEWIDDHRLLLSLEKYASAEVQLSQHYELPSMDALDIGTPLPIQITPEKIYARHMFHGPAYQGIRRVSTVAEQGIRGIIEGGDGKGSLLDNAGQLFGLWLQLTLQKDRIAFPVKITEVQFYSDRTDQQGAFECTCRLTALNDEFATADMLLKRDGRVWAIIRGWQNRRLEIDERLWQVSMAPLQHLLSEEIAPGVFIFYNAYQRVVSWDFILKRYFNQAEKRHYHALPPNRKKTWLISRVAVKDAVRALLRQHGLPACFPIEFEITADEAGQPLLQGDMTEGIHISLAHKHTDAVAIARYHRPAGIDIEEIQPRSEGFMELSFTPAERALIAGKDEAEWAARCWVAKEAYGKYLGKGLQGNPRAYEITAVNGHTLQINDVIINTIKHKNYIIGWTL